MLANCFKSKGDVKVFVDSRFVGYFPLSEAVKSYGEYYNAAIQAMKVKPADHIVYARDIRDAADNVETIYLYSPLRYTDEEFEKNVLPHNSEGIIRAIHMGK